MQSALSSKHLHSHAARDHEEAAQLHRDAAECHDQNRSNAAQLSAMSALAVSRRAHERSLSACSNSHAKEENSFSLWARAKPAGTEISL
ncbi:MAG: hypothetical protein A3E00_17195 [Curvibacter sp. RIFCSPHIGHO2_12_FULL_63_18]|uniref:hypothetical protein n=1 Tax=Rhodoferax sp. TaxID=50421 RepID=UPI0008B7DE4C|nr:hypothetical protein [Rhodoferax sp.]OGO96714.1 MAG: hypothetical protein A2037_09740 [Curvibacter sp. GWA2_63_95]OGO98597.1 MAG: hypothetical protein A3E00_17195 [Curvibacter sp. RIFCSPHIGHO2_12_FULL_63_18]HCX82605.1 hypothetical protein [Rhodoferax sp.]